MERLYLDSSVYGGYFDEEFKRWSRKLVAKFLEREYELVFSEVNEDELKGAPAHVVELVAKVRAVHPKITPVTAAAVELATRYIAEEVVGASSMADCLHIAIATLAKADILASWNFKHIVNVQRIRGYNFVNESYGHNALEIRTPREILPDEED
jgi:hypothetical protein